MKSVFYKALLIICSSLLAIEIASFLTILSLKHKILTSNPQDYVLASEQIASLKTIYDEKLGWDFKENTKYNERKSLTDYEINNTITFGDSFTRGDDVANNCTWQEFLEASLKQNVINFGIGAYGVDQAYLKYQVKKNKIPKIKNVILAFIPGDVNRNMTVYRNLIRSFEGGTELTKPYFSVNHDGKVILNENPIRNVNDMDKLRDSGFIKTLMAKDWWHTNHSFPYPKFPYSKVFFDKDYLNQLLNSLDYNPWFTKEGVLILSDILINFSKEVSQSGAKPLILFLPDFYFISGYFQKDHKRIETEKIFLQICKKQSLNCLSAVSVFSNKDDLRKLFNSQDESSHYSCKGNQLLAQYLLPHLLN